MRIKQAGSGGLGAAIYIDARLLDNGSTNARSFTAVIALMRFESSTCRSGSTLSRSKASVRGAQHLHATACRCCTHYSHSSIDVGCGG